MVTCETEKWNILQAKAHEERITLVFDEFRSHHIEPILIKGWAAARNYPLNAFRRSGDIDLAVAPNDFASASELISDPTLRTHLIDLHKGLRQLDSVDWDDLFANSILAGLNGSNIRVLRPEDHLRVLCVHWLTDGGAYKDKLWDIFYAVENRPDGFDWNRCLDVVDANRSGWVICAIAIAHRYLGLKVDDLPFVVGFTEIPKWITNCIEREWRRERLEPVLTSLNDRRLLLRQIMRRVPPNPIRATIEANGDLYGSRRLFYQAQVVARRVGPFTSDVVSAAKQRLKRNDR